MVQILDNELNRLKEISDTRMGFQRALSVYRHSDKRTKGEMDFLRGIDFGQNSQFFATAKRNLNVKSRVFDSQHKSPPFKSTTLKSKPSQCHLNKQSDSYTASIKNKINIKKIFF